MTEHLGCAIVTGGSRGIGRSVAIHLARDGYDVAFCYRADVEAAKETEQSIQEFGVRTFHAPCDVTDLGQVKVFLSAAEKALGPATVLVNSAGIVRDSPMVMMSPEDWHAVIDTNLNGTYNFCRTAVFGFMKRRAGVVVNISSVAGVYGHIAQTNYSASKAGIHGMSKALAKEVAGHGIRVNVVAPGFIETDMTAALPPKVRDQAIAIVPLRRFGHPDQVAEMVSFLVSDRAGYITGQIIQVDDRAGYITGQIIQVDGGIML